MHQLKSLLNSSVTFIKAHKVPSASICLQVCHTLKIAPILQMGLLYDAVDLLDAFVKDKWKVLEVGEWHEFLTVVLFNACAMNDDYVEEFRKEEQTQHGEVLATRQLEEHAGQLVGKLVGMEVVGRLLEAETRKNRHYTTLVWTISYLANKHHIALPPALKPHVQTQPPCIPEPRHLATLNQQLFGEGSQEWRIFSLLNQYYNTDLISVCRLLSANYLSNTRPLFHQITHTGEQVMEAVLKQMVRGNRKLLFGENDESRELQLFLSWFEYRYLALYLEWLPILQEVLSVGWGKVAAGVLEGSIPKFLGRLEHDYPEFVRMLHLVYEALREKESKETSVGIMKKLFLNRIILNPNMYLAYGTLPLSQSALLQGLNNLRVLFYRKKVPPSLLPLHQLYEERFAQLVESCPTGHQTTIYIMDKLLYDDYHNIDTHLHHEHKSQPSFSFSFLHATFIPEQPSPSPSRQAPIPKSPPTPHKTQRTEHTQHTDDAQSNASRSDLILYELVEKRRKLGARRRQIEYKKELRVEQRAKMRRELMKSEQQFEGWRKIIQKSNNLFKISLQIL